jgi:hypothetical protein
VNRQRAFEIPDAQPRRRRPLASIIERRRAGNIDLGADEVVEVVGEQSPDDVGEGLEPLPVGPAHVDGVLPGGVVDVALVGGDLPDDWSERRELSVESTWPRRMVNASWSLKRRPLAAV